MLKVALKGLAGRKLRAVLTAFAIVLGVAMVSGTFVLTDTIKAASARSSRASTSQTDIVITGRSAIGNEQQQRPEHRAVVPGVAARPGAASSPDVAAAEGGVGDQAQLVGRNGKVISIGFAPGLGFSVDAKGDQRFNPLVLTAGTLAARARTRSRSTSTPRRPSTTTSATRSAPSPAGRCRRTGSPGSSSSASVASIGGATMAIFDLPTAQKLLRQGREARRDRRRREAGHAGRRGDRSRSRPILPPTAQVRSGAQEAAKQTQDTSDFTSILQKFLLAFGGIALFVGVFVIANTLSITIAQRAREFGTLRTLGATRTQILRSVILEGAVIGRPRVDHRALRRARAREGPRRRSSSVLRHRPAAAANTVFATRTVIVSLVVGTLVTVVASLFPAMRATRVEPIAAVREGVLPPSRLARFGLPAAARHAGARAGAAALRRARDRRLRPVSACSRSASA